MNSLPIPTVSELKSLFAERGIRPNRRLGQNFLVDANAMRFVADVAELESRDVVLEVGAGTGGLTGLLAERVGAVVAVELDRKLYDIAAERLGTVANVELIHSDVMGRGGAIAAEVSEALARAVSSVSDGRLKLVANLPYCVSTALITALLFNGPLPAVMVVTVQKEVADRICAAPGAHDYGYLTVLVQAVAHAECLKRLSPKVFWPQPEVESCVLRIRPDENLRAAAGDLEKLRCVVSGLFTHRRKQAARALVTSGLANSRDEAREFLSAIKAPYTVRAEEITVDQFIALAHRTARRCAR